MSTKYKLILPLILCCKFTFAQTATCGTPGIDPDILVTMPYYANNAFLDDVITLTNGIQEKSSSNQANRNRIFNILVKAWVFHDDNGTNGALTNPEVEELII